MSTIGSLTLFREKSTVHRFTELGEADGEEAVLEIRSNRVTIPLAVGDTTYHAIVRGQNIPVTLRLVGLVIDMFRRDPNLVHDAANLDWESRWGRKLSTYEMEYNPDVWVSLHLDGLPIFWAGEGEIDTINEIEALAGAGEVNEAIVLEASTNVLGALEDLVVEHDSQTAFVFTAFAAYHRAAFLERKGGRTGSFATSVYHPTPKKPVRLGYFINFCADMLELLTLAGFLERVSQLVGTDAMASTPITPAQIAAARNRRRDLVQAIQSFEQAYKVTYRPERPSFN